ncbi:hypothetical protein B0T09DRAFT_186721 [Sordaria sp. MPI-SDFR-AT-0083]|nr:hypothetical protein B0T09DRAFT_186721 [Sordaria sp. MPI-SDFR-AT-0083]
MFDVAIPAIYSSFVIRWPDSNSTRSDTPTVNAPTSGLSTLCRNTDVSFAAIMTDKPGRSARFGGNNYAEHIKKFSIKDGPIQCIENYVITKPDGKMVNTLVASAVAKMTNLESFKWDMSTGVLSDNFMALASLSGWPNLESSKLKSVWIRWHDTSEVSPNPLRSTSPDPWGLTDIPVPLPTVQAGSVMTPIGCKPPNYATYDGSQSTSGYSQCSYEYPTFSILPPLKSLTVLNVEEPAYWDEMANLIERSKDTLEELRVGLSPRVQGRNFFMAWDGSTLKQVDHHAKWPGECTIGERRLGGVLGVLVGKIVRNEEARHY